jgi:hypothetical protein
VKSFNYEASIGENEVKLEVTELRNGVFTVTIVNYYQKLYFKIIKAGN